MNLSIQTQSATRSLISGLFGLGLLFASLPMAWSQDEGFDQHLERIRQLNISGQTEQARQLLEQARVVIAQRSPEQQIEYELLLAHNLGLRGEFETALDRLDELLKLRLSDLDRTRALGWAANLAATGRQHRRSFAYLREALLLVDQIDHPLHQSAVLGNAAQMLSGAGEIERAIAYGTRAVSLADLTDNTQEQCIARQRLVNVWRLAGQSRRLREVTDEAIEACERAGDPVFLAALANQQGRQLIEDGQLDAAEIALQRSIALAEEAEYMPILQLARLQLAGIFAERGEHERANRLAAEQLHLLTQGKRWEQLVTAHALLAQDYERQGNFSAALEHMEGQIQARTRQIEQERARRLAHLEVAYELSAREQEIGLLREQALAGELDEQANRQQALLRQLAWGTGAIIGTLLIILLVRTRRERRHFRRMARHDSLTGLLNHTHFFAATKAALAHAESAGSGLCLILADIDHFKAVNDQFGHLVGDQVLRRVAARIREQFPEPAIVGRIGGEEFAIALPDCQPDDARDRIEALRELINQARSGEEALTVALSFGLAAPQTGEAMEDLRRRADQALYQAKREGRNRLVMSKD